LIELGEQGLKGGRGESCEDRMYGKVGGTPTDAILLTVVMVQEVTEQARQTVTDITDEAYRLPMVGG